MSTHHDTGSGQQASADGPAGGAWVPEAPPSTNSALGRGGVQLQIGGRTVFAVYVSPVIVTVVSAGLGLLGWSNWPW